jgi:hypothetical protein
VKKACCLAILGVSLTAAVFSPSNAFCQQEPVYNGKTTSEWLTQLGAKTSGTERAQASGAIRQLGSNALPSLLRELREMVSVYATNPAIFDPVPTNASNWRASMLVQAFNALGENARAAGPELAKLFHQGSLPSFVDLMLHDADPKLGETTFVQALTNKSIEVRNAALGNLAHGPEPSNASVELAGLIYCLNDETPATEKDLMPGRSMAIMLRARAARARGSEALFDPQRAAAALSERLQREKEPVARTAMFYAFGRLGAEAQSAIPAWRQATNDADSAVAEQAAKSLKTIESTTPLAR